MTILGHELRVLIFPGTSDKDDRRFGDGHEQLLTAVQNGGAGAVSRRLKLVAHICASLRFGKIAASAVVLPIFAGRPRSAIRYGVLERSSSACADERTQQ